MDNPAGDAPWGVNPKTGRPYTRSPEERAAIGASLAQARQAKAEARQAEVAESAPAVGELPPIDRSAEDREPGSRPARRRVAGRRRRSGPPAAPVDVPPFRAGPIAKGMNRLYAKAGRVVKVLGSPRIGDVIISMTRKESDDDDTVGEAWEALAQVSPVWRARLLKICSGGAGGRVVMAHMPLLLAIVMLDSVRKRIPFAGIAEAVLSDDETPAGPDAAGEPSFEDLAAMAAMAQNMMGPMAAMFAGRAPQGPARTPTAEDLQTVAAPQFDEAAA